MCGRFGLEHPEFTETRFQAQLLPDVKPEELLIPRYNIAPTEPVLAVAPSKRLDGQRGIKAMRWGLTPQWALADRTKPRPINIKTEGILDRPVFRRLLAYKRCVIPAGWFYEWSKLSAVKRPYEIGVRGSDVFGFAGLWDAAKDGDDWLVSCTILTTKPNSLVATLHDRQPVILTPEQEEAWLDPERTDPGEFVDFFSALPESAMEMEPVSPLVGDANNKGPEVRSRPDNEPQQRTLL